MIKLKNILLEKDEKPDSENPDKILVKNKESGKSYYISKDSFDASVHEKSESPEKKKKEEPKEKSSDGEETTGKKKKQGGVDLMAGLDSGSDKDEKDKSTGGEKKKLSPREKLEKKLGSFVFLDNKEKEEIADDAKNFRPDLKKKLLKFEFTPFFRSYDELLDTLAIQNRNKDNEGSKATITTMKKVAKRIQGIAVAKLAVLSPKQNDSKTISSAKFYHSSNNLVNEILRNGDEILTNEQIEKIQKELDDNPQFLSVKSNIGSLPKYDRPLLNSMRAINDLDEHFKSDGARLQSDTVAYRGLRKEVLQKFIDAGDWVDNGFVSTSLNPIIAEDFTDRGLTSDERKQRTPILKINLKRGDRVLMLPCSEDEFCIESEITLPRGCKFKITGKDEEKNIYDVSVEFPNA